MVKGGGMAANGAQGNAGDVVRFPLARSVMVERLPSLREHVRRNAREAKLTSEAAGIVRKYFMALDADDWDGQARLAGELAEYVEGHPCEFGAGIPVAGPLDEGFQPAEYLRAVDRIRASAYFLVLPRAARVYATRNRPDKAA